MGNKTDPIQIENARIAIKVIDENARTMLKNACEIRPSAVFTKAQLCAMTDFRSCLRDLMGIHLGELKNYFGIGIKQELEQQKL